GYRDRPLKPVLHAELREAITRMEDQRDDSGADTVEDSRDRFEITKIDVETTQCGDNHKVWKDESPTAYPGAPKTAAQVRNIDSNLNREWPWQRLADRDGFTHLLFGQPATLGNEFTFHLPDQRDRTTKSQQPKSEKVAEQLRPSSALGHGITSRDR